MVNIHSIVYGFDNELVVDMNIGNGDGNIVSSTRLVMTRVYERSEEKMIATSSSWSD